MRGGHHGVYPDIADLLRFPTSGGRSRWVRDAHTRWVISSVCVFACIVRVPHALRSTVSSSSPRK
eukprot:scaffold127391_cov32-Tisochrysis_lutea.AAC.3